MHESYQTAIRPEVDRLWQNQVKEYEAKCKAEGIEPDNIKPKADFHAEVARNLFDQLSNMEKAALKERTHEDAARAREKFDEDTKKPPAKDPVSHQT